MLQPNIRVRTRNNQKYERTIPISRSDKPVERRRSAVRNLRPLRSATGHSLAVGDPQFGCILPRSKQHYVRYFRTLCMSFLDWPIEVERAPCNADARRQRLAEEPIVRLCASISANQLRPDVGLAADQRSGLAARGATRRWHEASAICIAVQIHHVCRWSCSPR